MRLRGRGFRAKNSAITKCAFSFMQLAYNLGVFLQSVDLPEEVKGWSLTSLQTKLIKIGAKVIRHSCYITFQMAEVALPRSLFARILAAIQRLRAPPLAI
jgi:hypothetical protein